MATACGTDCVYLTEWKAIQCENQIAENGIGEYNFARNLREAQCLSKQLSRHLINWT